MNDTTEQKEIYTEQVRQLYANEPIGMIATAVNATILAFVQWHVVSHSVIVIWLSCMLFLTGLRLLRRYLFKQTLINAENAQLRAIQFMIGIALSGIGWGLTSVLLFPDTSIAHQVFLTFVLGGMVAGAVAALSSLQGVFISFSLAALLPLIARLFLFGDYIHVTMGAMASLFVVLTFATSLRIQRTLVTSLKLRFENRNLIQYLEDAKERLEQINKKLASEVSERKQAERALKQAYEELKSTQTQLIQSAKLASIGELASGVAHELNQPLMVIRSTTQFIQRNINKSKFNLDELMEQLLPVERNTTRMMNIIDHLRAFSRQSKAEFSPQDMNKIIENALEMIGEQLRLRSIEVNLKLASDIPNVLGDNNQLEQVVLNLFTNARDAILEKSNNAATHTGSSLQKAGAIKIVTCTQDGKGTVDILVKDSGCGIPAEDIEKLFDPFFTTKAEGKGTGLGLSISYGIIKEHQGEIHVAETGPDGTTFKVRLPAYP